MNYSTANLHLVWINKDLDQLDEWIDFFTFEPFRGSLSLASNLIFLRGFFHA